MKSKTVFLALFLALFQLSNAYCLETSLFPRFSGKTVKVYVAEVKDATQTHELDPAMVKTRMEKSLGDRKSIKFQIVPTAAEADLTIETQIAGFTWSDHDPVDMLVGVGGTAMDAAVVEDYAAIEATVTVSDVKSNQPVWKKKLFATVTKKPMPKEDSKPLAIDSFLKVFIRDCFSKRKN